MKYKDFKKMLRGIDDDAEIIFSSDEELNNLRAKGEIAYLEDKKKYVIYGLDGTEID